MVDRNRKTMHAHSQATITAFGGVVIKRTNRRRIDTTSSARLRSAMARIAMSLALFSALLGCSNDDSCTAYADKVMKCDTSERTPNQDDALSRSLLVGLCRKGGATIVSSKACMKHQECPAFNACEADVEKAAIKAAVDKATNDRK
jgi:hypothetical protein